MAGVAGALAELNPFVEHIIHFFRPVRPILAMGAWFKNTLCITSGNQALLSKIAGDLDTAEACIAHEQMARALLEQIAEKPLAIAHDLHPDFHSTRFAARLAAELDIPLCGVQHHHAHIAAVCAEHGVDEPVLGLALDGVGLGTDGAAWGGELLFVEGSEFERIGHLSFLLLPGGDRAAREPWRMVAAALFRMGRGEEIARRFPGQAGAQTVLEMLQRGLNCPPSSSMGRLFDAAAGLLGVCEVQSHEAEAAIRLQELAASYGKAEELAGGYRIAANGELDFSPLLAVLADCGDAAYGAALFHGTLAAGLAEWAGNTARERGLVHVALGGGCFHNAILLQLLTARLTGQGLRVMLGRQLSPGDSAISLGQAWVAMHSLDRGR